MTPKPTVLHIGKYDPLSRDAGGIERVLLDLTDHLKEDTTQKTICFSREISRNVACHRNGIETLLIPVQWIVGHAPLNLSAYRDLYRLIHSFRPKIIHAHMPGILPLFLLFIPTWGGRLLLHWHADVWGSDVARNPLFPLYRMMEWQLLKQADRVIVTSPHYLAASRSLAPWKKKCVVIPLGTPPPLGKPAALPRKMERMIQGKQLILSIGRMTYYKGFEFLIHAMEDLIKSRKKEDIALIMAGDGPLRHGLQKQVVQKGLDRHILLPGHIDEALKEALLERADIFCLSSIDRAEAFGVVLLEAMAHKIPLITTRIEGSGVNFVNIDKKTGITVPPRDPHALSNAIETFLTRFDKAKKMGHNGFHRWMTHFRSDIFAERIRRLYLY